jgi:hypothetical protein
VKLLDEKAVGFLFDKPVAPASSGFQAWAVDNGNVAATVADQISPLQGSGGFTHTAAVDSEHLGEKFLGEPQLFGLSTILVH